MRREAPGCATVATSMEHFELEVYIGQKTGKTLGIINRINVVVSPRLAPMLLVPASRDLPNLALLRLLTTVDGTTPKSLALQRYLKFRRPCRRETPGTDDHSAHDLMRLFAPQQSSQHCRGGLYLGPSSRPISSWRAAAPQLAFVSVDPHGCRSSWFGSLIQLEQDTLRAIRAPAAMPEVWCCSHTV